MLIRFIPRGRLGNAIFRYMASYIMCKYYNGKYVEQGVYGKYNLSDENFYKIQKNILEKKIININFNGIDIINMNGFYQHDEIYLKHKQELVDFINNNPSHYVITDGIKAGDNNCQKFYMKDIINTPDNFNKKYKLVLHLRLEDFMDNNLYIKPDRIINLIDKLLIDNILKEEIVIICNKPTKREEVEYISILNKKLLENNIKIILEHNDILTDFYILKEAEILISSNSTLCWCATLFSNNLKICYFPEYTSNSQTFKKPIPNTYYY
jgi:hypothetical protein